MRIKIRAIPVLATALAIGSGVWAHPGIGIVMDSRGNVFYTDLRHVWKISPDGKKTIAVRNVHTHELCLDADDNLYGEHLWYEGERTDKWGHYVWRLQPDGRLEKIIPPREGFLQNYSFIRDRRGNMYWADRGSQTRIQKRTPDGHIQTLASTSNFQDVRWMMSTPEGTLYLIDYASHYADLYRITTDGKIVRVARDLGETAWWQFVVGDRHVVMGLWTDSAENVYAAVYGGRLVKKVSPDGHVSVIARSSVPWSPTGGMIARNGDLWLLEYSVTNAARVRRISKDGRRTTF
ncbi:MAG TPA: hypothetical protein VGL91_14525 [Acidobacteriota bacterium]|jgi:hypothetical protein